MSTYVYFTKADLIKLIRGEKINKQIYGWSRNTFWEISKNSEGDIEVKVTFGEDEDDHAEYRHMYKGISHLTYTSGSSGEDLESYLNGYINPIIYSVVIPMDEFIGEGSGGKVNRLGIYMSYYYKTNYPIQTIITNRLEQNIYIYICIKM